MKEEKPIIFFDGICNLCNGAIQRIIRHDLKGYFKLASLQSDFARKSLTKEILGTSGKDDRMESILLYDGKKIFRKSTAILKIAGKLSGGYKLLQVFWIVPRFLRDRIYDWIARNRYKWFGRRTKCIRPTPDVEDRFII